MAGIVPVVESPRIEVRRAADRAVTEAEGRRTEHSFSFGEHYDPDNVGFGPLIAHNDERLSAGGGYPDHPHRDVEIVTVVLDGVLRHHSATSGGTVDLGPGQAQVLSAGAGVVHAETAARGPVRFVQSWLRPDELGGAPTYRRAEVWAGEGLAPVAGEGAEVGIGASATLYVARLAPEAVVALPDAARLHVFVTEGALTLGEVELQPSDAARVSGMAGVTAHAAAGATALVWAAR